MIFLMRHGECVDNADGRVPRPDSALTERGRLAARSAAVALSRVAPRLRHVYASDLPRARETANLVAERGGIVVRSEPRIREIDFGAAAGLPEADFDTAFPHHARSIADLENLEFRWPGGESRREALTRALAAIADAESLGEDTLLVGHWCVWALVRAYQRGQGMANWTDFVLRSAQIVPLDEEAEALG